MHISLVDFNKDWLLLRAGLDVPLSAVTIPMQNAMPCLPNVTVIEDTQMHPTYRKHSYPPSLGMEGSLRFYSETSLNIEGTKVGRVCIADTHPRHDFCLDQQTMFVALADTISGLIADKWAHEQEEHYNGIYFHELMLDVLKDVVQKLIETKGQLRSLFLLTKRECKENGMSSKFSELSTSLQLASQTFQREQTFLNHFFDAQMNLDIDEKIPFSSHQQLQKLEIGIDRDQIFTFPFSPDEWISSLQTVSEYYRSLSMPMHFENRLDNGPFRITSHPDVLLLCISALFGHLYAAFDNSHSANGNGDVASSLSNDTMTRRMKSTKSSPNGIAMIRVVTSVTKQLPNGAPRHLCLQISSSKAIPPVFKAMQHALDTLVQQYLCGRCRFITEFSFQILVPILPAISTDSNSKIPSAVRRASVSSLSLTGGGYGRANAIKMEASSLANSMGQRSIPALNSIALQISSVASPTPGHKSLSPHAQHHRSPVSGTSRETGASVSGLVHSNAEEVTRPASHTHEEKHSSVALAVEGSPSRHSLRDMAHQLVDSCKHLISMSPTGSTSFLFNHPPTPTLTHGLGSVQKVDNELSTATTLMDSSGSFDQPHSLLPCRSSQTSESGVPKALHVDTTEQSPNQTSAMKPFMLTASLTVVSNHHKVAPVNGQEVYTNQQSPSATTITGALSHLLLGHQHNKVAPAVE